LKSRRYYSFFIIIRVSSPPKSNRHPLIFCHLISAGIEISALPRTLSKVSPLPVKEIILLSACLSGHLVRYNGTDKSCSSDLLQHWRKEGRLVTHCPQHRLPGQGLSQR